MSLRAWGVVGLLAGCATAPAPRLAREEAPAAPALAPPAPAIVRVRAPEPVPEPPAPAPRAPTLYARVGGLEAIRAVVPKFLENVSRDTRINYLFSMSDLETLQVRLVEFFCSALGGPCTYTGRDMRTAHAQLPIANKHFDAMVEDLAGALDHFKVPARERGEILGALATMRDDIVRPH